MAEKEVRIDDSERRKAVDELVEVYVNRKDLNAGLKAVELGSSQQIRDVLLAAFLNDESNRGTDFIKSIFKLVQLSVSRETLVCLAKVAIKEDWVTGYGADMTKKLSKSQIVMQAIMKQAIDMGNITTARALADLGKIPFTVNEINDLVKANCLKGDFNIAKDAAELAARELTAEEIKTLTEAIKKGFEVK